MTNATGSALHIQSASKVPTTWRTNQPVSIDLMDKVYNLPKVVPDGWLNQFRYMCQLYWLIARGVVGDVVECGLGEGHTFAMLAYLMGMEHWADRTLWGFDSFEGWPQPDPSDASPRNPQQGEWQVTEKMIHQQLEVSGIRQRFHWLDIQIRKGFLADTLPEFPDRPIAFLHLDVDLHPGYRDGLHHLFPLVVPGGVIAFDEYREYHPELPEYVVDGYPVEKWPGCTKAVDEYLKAHNRSEQLRYHGPTQKYYLIKGSV